MKKPTLLRLFLGLTAFCILLPGALLLAPSAR